MGKPLTREIAGLVWTWKPDYEAWTTEDGLYVIRYDEPPGFPGGVDYLAPRADKFYKRLTAACEAEVAHREATRAGPTATPTRDTAIEDGPVAQSASPTLDPGELDRMIGEEEPVPPGAWTAARRDQVTAEREAQRRDERAYYRDLAGWAVAALVLVALCSGVLR